MNRPRKPPINARHIEPRFDNEVASFRSFEDNVKNTKIRREARKAMKKAEDSARQNRIRVRPMDASGKPLPLKERRSANPNSKLGPAPGPPDPKTQQYFRKKAEERRKIERKKRANPLFRVEPIVIQEAQRWPRGRT